MREMGFCLHIYAQEPKTLNHVKVMCASDMRTYYGISVFDAIVDIFLEELLDNKKYFDHI